MKQSALVFVALFAVNIARAATLTWGVNMDSLLYVTEDGSAVTTANTYTGDTTDWKYCLVWLGTSSTIDISSVSDDNVVDSIAYGVWVNDDNGRAYPDEYSHDFVTTGTATSLSDKTVTIAAGDYFGIVFYNGTSYSNVFAVDGDAVGSAIGETVQLSNLGTTANTVYHQIGEGDPGGIAVSAVPEPSVALLGLLGLGMLLKRRKA